ncbi:hypothetical protein KIN20_003977 [Parelaphostrongylus tenuis]|uniref:F-box domain-containing protein n=1 Tax=Parelaphostrongylus tenuis TaxID=148309 RepID=A0AAD5QES3_PARTN|nr:hypothetical protein KIN20_003977 [Parelaphostrongylus tenuis]
MNPTCFPLPDDVVLMILRLLDGKTVRSCGSTCRRFRRLILRSRGKLPKPVLTWREAHLVFGRTIVLSRSNPSVLRGRKQRRTSSVDDRWEFTVTPFSFLSGIILRHFIFNSCHSFFYCTGPCNYRIQLVSVRSSLYWRFVFFATSWNTS